MVHPFTYVKGSISVCTSLGFKWILVLKNHPNPRDDSLLLELLFPDCQIPSNRYDIATFNCPLTFTSEVLKGSTLVWTARFRNLANLRPPTRRYNHFPQVNDKRDKCKRGPSNNLLMINFTTLDLIGPNVVVEWLVLLLCIREVPGSNLGPETGYPDWDFSWFFSVPPEKFRDSTLN
jgi:hypothetical protein